MFKVFAVNSRSWLGNPACGPSSSRSKLTLGSFHFHVPLLMIYDLGWEMAGTQVFLGSIWTPPPPVNSEHLLAHPGTHSLTSFP